MTRRARKAKRSNSKALEKISATAGAAIGQALGFGRKNPEELIGYIYLLRKGDLIKIGHGKNPSQRWRVFNNASPDSVLLEHKLRVINVKSAERWLHRHFSDKLIKNEWFRLTIEDVAWLKALSDGFYNEST